MVAFFVDRAAAILVVLVMVFLTAPASAATGISPGQAGREGQGDGQETRGQAQGRLRENISHGFFIIAPFPGTLTALPRQPLP